MTPFDKQRFIKYLLPLILYSAFLQHEINNDRFVNSELKSIAAKS